MGKRVWKHTRVKQVGGDDGYCWAVLLLRHGQWKEAVNGLTRSEVGHYRDRFERGEEAMEAVKANCHYKAVIRLWLFYRTDQTLSEIRR